MSPPRPAPSTGPEPGSLRGVLEPLVAAAGFDLEQLDVRTTGRRHSVTITVDADAGVGLDDIAELSRIAATELDRHEHLIGGSYTLEVTSPGVDRPLTGPRHWRRAHLRQVAVRTHDGEEFTGRVGSAGGEAVMVLVDGRLRELRYADVEHAGVQVEFRPAPEDEVALIRSAEVRSAVTTGPAAGHEEDS
jgi:ribosome maturation factor RimP